MLARSLHAPWPALALAAFACTPAGRTMPPPVGKTPTLPPPAADMSDEGEDSDTWTVDQPPYPTKEVPLAVERGSWMSVDVSPDGAHVAFDLLGDLYEVPMAGGAARRITSGISWDMQPRYSPDGRWIAFTSDRGGGDNIWIVPREGGEPRAVTHEKFRLLNSPTWSPDGQSIVARKHYTGTRSLGAGELWHYHVSGGEGVQLTKRANDQKDLGEPAFSPDGRYLYYSQDTTPGTRFEYNKDPHGQIYVIQRLDLQEGRTEPFVTGPGGAVRPTPSPDGKQLAFVRRVGLDTVLFVMDVASGRMRPVYRGLERDMQETWAIHGVYPGMAWTPDGRAVVLWAGGTLHHVDVANGADQPIPFRVEDSRRVAEAVRVPVEVHPKTFDVKMLRWVTVSPDGDFVVFQALGHLYLRSLPDGQARRLTSDDDVVELYPSFSRDGKSIVYTTWNDDDLGTVRVVSARGGRPRVVSRGPGHYVRPLFTPKGDAVLVERVGAGPLRDPAFSREQGLWRLPLRGDGEPTLVTREGEGFHFGADPDRVYFAAEAGKEGSRSYELRSVDLHGGHPRTHATGKWTTRFRVSPDGKWLAFQEGFAVYVTPFVRTPLPFAVGPKMKSMPVAKAGHDAGANLHWSGDGKRLHWSLGPELYTRELAESFAFLDGAADPLPPPVAKGRNISFSAPADAPSGSFALVGAQIVTQGPQGTVKDGVVVVRGDRIVAVGPRASTPVPAGATTYDVAGKTIYPGLVDVHAHGPQGSHGIIPQRNWLHYAELAFGVTTVHDPSNDTETIFAAAELARTGQVTAPRIFSTGTILYGAETPFMARIDSLEDARFHLRRMKAVGAISVKSYNQPRREQRQQVLTAARELGLMVVPEGGSLFQHNMTMVVDGHTGIEHALPVPAVYDDVLTLWPATKVGYTPTLVVGYGGLWGENYWYAKSDVFAHPRLRAFVPPFAYEPRARRRLLASEGDWNHIRIARACKQLQDAGVSIQLGAHGQREGLAAHWELWSFVQGGMTPEHALRAATLDGARYLGLDRDLGSIEPGKLADLVVADGDVLADIRASDDVRYVVLGGRLYEAATMEQLAPDPTPAPRFFWQDNAGAPADAAFTHGGH